MAQSNELNRVRLVTTEGIVTSTVVDKVSPDRIGLMLIKGSAAARHAVAVDNTTVVKRDIKDLLVFPFSEL